MESLCNIIAKQARNLNENETLLSSESNIQSSRVHSPGFVPGIDDFNKSEAFIDAAIGVKTPRMDNLETLLKTHLKLGFRRWLDKDSGSGSASSTIWSPKTVLYMEDVRLPVFLEGSHDCGSSDEEEEVKMVKRPKLDNLESELETHKESSVPLTKKVLCSHSTGIVHGMCILCGQIMDKETGVKFECIQKELGLFDEEFVREKNHLVSRKKLCLVLDLDHTLLHTSKIVDMKPKEESCEGLFKFDSLQIMTKLRPFVHNFLREASEMFEMYIYTMGNKSYALEMAKLLDPKDDDYFTGRIISREDSTQEHQKSLNKVPVHESVVLILDDKESVWTKHKDNLILMKRYNFFPSKANQVGFNFKSLSEQNADENKSGGALSTVLKVLKQIHSLYFEQVVVANNLMTEM
ncbi:RNA polymerase II C-terminal domain phosphatase-like 4 [Tripterygium wilfordii]|uniref:RNA polymerase II C-terminal domain phosphatase-like n=1 Tax=Tripterygium wilfordii TaxID=458696 RepID=A0A7J7CF91_TRIWF|nr:RNA polymerase II C-terminal domain phosphatase-like 4 [Tripterygium wilfordii]